MASLKLKHNPRIRALNGHPWVFAGEVQKLLPSSENGKIVSCRDGKGFLLGDGIYNSKSQIVWRRLSKNKIDNEEAFIKEALEKAIAQRHPEPVRRLIWSEADNLPGLIVDQYEDSLVLQTLTLGIDQRVDLIIDHLKKLLSPQNIILRNDVSIRELEGLKEEVKVVHGNEPSPRFYKIGEMEYKLDLMKGHKTGTYLDQRDQHESIGRACAHGKRVLDLFTYQGGFALHCSKYGATEVTAIDISADNITLAKENAEKNKLKINFQEANVFDFLKANNKKTWDVIILDPPSFTRSKSKVQDALRGYKELHLRCFQMLQTGGILATYSCSHHIDEASFYQMIEEAAWDAKKEVRLLENAQQAHDHPVKLNIPETKYLKGYVLEVL